MYHYHEIIRLAAYLDRVFHLYSCTCMIQYKDNASILLLKSSTEQLTGDLNNSHATNLCAL